MLESPNATQANKNVLSEATAKFSNVQDVVMFASLNVANFKEPGTPNSRQDFQLFLRDVIFCHPSLPVGKQIGLLFSYTSCGKPVRRYEMGSIQAMNIPPPRPNPSPSGGFPFDRSTYGQNGHGRIHITHIIIEITQNPC